MEAFSRLNWDIMEKSNKILDFYPKIVYPECWRSLFPACDSSEEGLVLTIKDLAAQTGYSVGTISRVLNDRPNVSSKAREAILAAVETSGFQLNINAKQLKQQKTDTILVLVKGSGNELFGSLLETIQRRIMDTRYPLVVDYMDEDRNEVQRALQLFREKKPRGILFLGGNKDNFTQEFSHITVPCVMVTSDASGLPHPNLSSVVSDDRLGANLAIRHLLDLGHRHIGVIGGSQETSDTSRLRYLGCLDAFRDNGLQFDEGADFRWGRFSYADGYRAATSLLHQPKPPTAIFAMADVMAIGAIRAIRDSGLRVPEDVSVVGYDGLVLGEYFVPKLATICQNVELLADRSVDLLLSQMNHSGAPQHEIVPVTIRAAESAQPPNSKE